MSDPPTPRPDPSLSQEAASDVDVVAKGGAVQIAGQFSQRSLTFFFTALAFRILGASTYGLYRQVTQVLSIAGQLGLAGFNYASMRFISRARARNEPGAVRGYARIGLGGALISSALVVVALLLLSESLGASFGDTSGGERRIAQLLRIGALYVPLFATLQVLRYCTQAYKTMVPSVVAGNIVLPAARFVLGAAALIAGYQFANPKAFQLTGSVVTYVASDGIAAAVAAVLFRRMLTESERTAPRTGAVAPMVRFALPQAGASLLGVQTLGIGIILLGLVSDDRSVALFTLALSLQGPGNIFLGGIVNIWAPVVADLFEKGEIGRLDSLYKTINRWIATFSFPVLAALIIMPEFFGRIYGGSQGAAAAPVIAVLAVGNFFYTGTGPTGYVISMTGRPGLNFVNSVVAVGLYVPVGIWAARSYGVVGVAWVDAGVTALINSVRVVEAKLLVGVQPFGRSYFKPVAATIAGAAVLFVWKLMLGESLWVGIAGLVVGALVFVGVLKLLGVDPEERHVYERIRARALRRRAREKR